MNKILIVEDDISFTITLKTFLERQGFATQEATCFAKAIQHLNNETFDVVLTDFRLPDKDGIELLKVIKEKGLNPLVILMTAYADLKMAIKAIKFGAYEYISKPVNPDELMIHIKQGLQKQQENAGSNSENPNPSKARSNTSQGQQQEYVKAQSPESTNLHKHIDLVAGTDLSVIIEGESGTGKEYIARKIHSQSPRKDKKFVAVDCGVLSKELAAGEFFGHLKGSFTGAIQDKTGQFEAANHGTLFLDEIGNLSYDIQAKLLRALQERQIRKIGSNKDIRVDVRIIVATNEDLKEAVKNGEFREDLFHRLNEFSIHVPALRERKADVKLFVHHFLEMANAELNKKLNHIPEDIMNIFLSYSWPGNIREIKNVVRRAVLLSPGAELIEDALPPEMILEAKMQGTASRNESNTLKERAHETERQTIIEVLQQAKYNKSKAARMLNIDRRTLYNKLKLYNIDLE